MTVTDHRPDTVVDDAPPARDRLRTTLLAVLAVAALVIAAGGGWFLRGSSDDGTPAGPNAVDVGFAQDMTTHHVQAVTMAGIERDGTSDAQLRILAFDIETGQQFQVGQMSGWLQAWGKGRNNPDPMAWMGHDMGGMSMGASGDLMPGMATPAQMDALSKATGKARDVLFLQLMIHHHQGALPMARYALEHGSEQEVVDLAQAVINSQTSEIVQMEQMLRALGGKELPPPS